MHKLLVVFGLLSMAAQAGPPLICHPYDIGTAKSLPWGHDVLAKWDNPDSHYDTHRLSADTLSLLNPQTPVLVRKETLRRAAIYGAADQGSLLALVASLRQRADEQAGALALFDYGYLLATMKQLEWRYKRDLTGGVDGGALVKTALSLGRDAEMEKAAQVIAASSQAASK